MKKLFLAKIMICLLITFFSFQNCKKQTISSNNIALQIDTISIPEYQFNKAIKDFKWNIKKIKNKNIYNDTLKKWLNAYIDDKYFLADAINKQYDTVSQIDINVNNMSKYMISSYKGYLWNELEQPKINEAISLEKLKEAYEKSDKIYYVKIISINEQYKHLISKVSNTNIDNAKFEHFIKVFEKINKKYVLTNPFRYPSFRYFELNSIITEMKVGDSKIYNPCFGTAYLIQLLKVESINLNPFEKEKEKLSRNIKNGYEKYLVDSKQNEIMCKANLDLDTIVINHLVESWGNKEELDTSLIIASFEGVKNKEIITIKYFMDKYANYPYPLVITDISHVKIMIKKFILNQYLTHEAQQYRILENIEFLADMANYRDKIIVSNYTRSEILNKVKISDLDITNYYNANISRYKSYESAEYEIYTFSNHSDAIVGYQILNGKDNRSQLKNIEECKYEIIHYKSLKYSLRFKNEISKLDTGILSFPIQENDKFYVLKKINESGVRIKKEEEVEKEIRKKLTLQKREQFKTESLNALKKKYLIINNIDVDLD